MRKRVIDLTFSSLSNLEADPYFGSVEACDSVELILHCRMGDGCR